MTDRSAFTETEWTTLLDVPPAVGTAVMHAGRSGVGTIKESLAMVNSIMRADAAYPGNELIESLVQGRLKHGEKSRIETLDSPYVGKEPEEILEDAVGKCRDVVELLTTKATDQELDDYCDWTLTIGQKVAEAAKEGGFLGIGGERVSEAEQQALKAIKRALCA